MGLVILLVAGSTLIEGQSLDDWKSRSRPLPMDNTIVTPGQFNGYIVHWSNEYWRWLQYGNLFQMSQPDPEKTITQSKLDLAEELGIPGFWMEEGFLSGLLGTTYSELVEPDQVELLDALKDGPVLALVDSGTDLGRALEGKLPSLSDWKNGLKSTQFSSEDYLKTWAFVLEKGEGRLFVVSSSSRERRRAVKKLIDDVKTVLAGYDLHRGWPGVQTRFYSVTCWPYHPLEIIGMAMNQGNDWLTFCGYMDYLLQKELDGWLDKVNLPFVTDVGSGRAAVPVSLGLLAYGLRDYEGFKPQDMHDLDGFLKYVREKGGYVFRPVYEDALDSYHLDGRIGILGNKEQIDNEDVPFIITSGQIKEGAVPCMVLFLDKGAPLTRNRMYEAIFARRSVAVMELGRMMGERIFRNALQMLLLDRVFLEDYFGDRIQIKAEVDGRELTVTLINTAAAVSGRLDITLPPELNMEETSSLMVDMPADSYKILSFSLKPTLEAMDKDNPIAVHFKWEERKKETLTVMQMPRAISVHQLLYGHAPQVAYPVTIHNFTERTEYPVRVQVFAKNDMNKSVFDTTREGSAAPGEFQTLDFPLALAAGEYRVKVTALGAENNSQLGVGSPEGRPYLYEVDLNSDGVNEYRMENDKVQVTLLSTGARVIEYIVKERNDNVLFKLWPEKSDTHRRPFRKRQFYPYGGFEDFLGQPSVETHKVYDAEILKKEGDFVRVRMTADYYGNRLEKIFTLYGDSPLLEVRFALNFENPETNMLGPQPIIALGEKHWTEDQFLMPTKEGIQEFRMLPEKYYGRVIDLTEGWNAAYDTQEDITFIGAFPVSEPEFLHMWMNHPVNRVAHHYYAELQPWVPIYRRSTMYFSYYLWGDAGPWEKGVETLRTMGLVTER
jgi:hypothetical protein